MSIAWKLFLSHLLVVVIAIISLGLYLNHEVDRYYLASLQESLTAEAALIANALGPDATRSQSLPTSRSIVAQSAESAGLRVTLIAADGSVLADSESNPATMENHATRPEVSDALAKGRGSSIRRSATLGVDMLYVARTLRSAGTATGVIRVALPLRAIAAAEARIRRRLLLAALAAIIVSLLISLLFSTRPLRAIRRLTNAAASLAAGKLDATVPVRGNDELASLAANFETMARRIQVMVRELNEQKQRVETIFSHMGEAIIVTDAIGHIARCNPAFERVFGFACEQARGLTIADATKSSTLDEAFRRALAGEQTTAEVRVLFPVQGVLEATVTSIADDQTLGAVGILHDVTQLRRLETVRREFVANASHELQTPITAIKAMAETLLAGGRDDPALADRFLRDLTKQSDRLGALVRDLLDLASVEAGAQAEGDESVRVSPVISGVVDQLRSPAEQRGITIEVDLPEDITVQCDRTSLNRIFSNLLDNAIKYTESGGQVGISSARSDDMVAITVWDTGIGIPSTDLDRVFERFYRVDKARARDLGGTGLGLSIVKHLVESLGGRVSVESELGRGSRFTVHLPAVQSS